MLDKRLYRFPYILLPELRKFYQPKMNCFNNSTLSRSIQLLRYISHVFICQSGIFSIENYVVYAIIKL